MPVPTLADLTRRPTARELELRRGDLVWYVDMAGDARPGTFERYGVIRVAILLATAKGTIERIYVQPGRVYSRRPDAD